MIEIRGLHKRYPTAGGHHPALRGVDLHVGAGEIFGIIGPSGAGKSTLVQCINLLERPDAGSIAIGGQTLTGLDEAQLRRHRQRIGMVFQGFHLMTRRTVHGNVALPLEIAGVAAAQVGPRVDRLLELVGLSALGERYPAQLSGGQKQRVGIARALANEPDVLLSDEATSALDPETTASILALLRRINRQTGITVVMITHQMDVVRAICDRVAVLDQGQVVEQGDTAELFAAPRHPVTRAMVAAATASELTAESLQALRRRLDQREAGDGAASVQLWRLRLCGGEAGDWISRLARDTGLDLTLLQARVEDIQGNAVGTVFVLARGSAAALEQGRQALGEHRIQPQVVEMDALQAGSGR